MPTKKRSNSNKKSWLLPIVLMLLLPTSLTACDLANSDPPQSHTPAPSSIPPWPSAGAAVADELDRCCPTGPGLDGKPVTSCPALYSWLGRLDKFKQQIDVLRPQSVPGVQ